jgi:Spy/CpxP family protein refolding chaperone
LTPEQQQALWDIRKEYQSKLLSLNRELYATRLELWGYEARPEVDVQKIRDYRNTLLELEKKIGEYRIQAREKMNKILTQEQKTYWSGDDRWFGGNWCPMISGIMMGGMSHPRGMIGY